MPDRSHSPRPIPPRYVFVAGLHRTGTSLLARMIATSPQVAAIANAPVPENEGCYLQGAIPHTALDGVPGEYATDPRQHHTEGGRYDTLETRRRLEADWAPWFASGRRWRLEKSPVNLTRTRLYQALFPTAQFVVILRHPEAMAMSLAKWTSRPGPELVGYGLAAYERVRADLPFLHNVLVIRYEDLVSRPATHAAAIGAFLQLPEPPDAGSVALFNGNARGTGTSAMMDEGAARLAGQWGYGPGLDVRAWQPVVRHALRSVREATEAALGAEEDAFPG